MTTTHSELNKDMLLWAYEKMVTIRRFEVQARREADAGKLRGMHPSIGQEAVTTGICAPLPHDDSLLGTHRRHPPSLPNAVDRGSMLALLDTTGALAAWSETGPGAFKASTVGVHAHMVAPAGAEDLVAYGRLTQRDNEIFWCDVEVATRSDQNVVARGTVLYRIVIPKDA